MCREFLRDSEGLLSADVASWLPNVVTAVSDSYLQVIQTLMETVRQMDTALQRRSKLRANTPQQAVASTASMSDSEKITLQLYLDMTALCDEIRGWQIALPPAFAVLSEELADAERFVVKAI